MKKDKEWLKDKVKSLFDKAYDLGKMDYYVSEESIHRINSLIDQLEEPEVPAIPQFIADWYEENLSGGYTNNRNKFSGNDVFRVIQDVLNTSKGLNAWGDYGVDKKITAWVEENEEDFIHLIANCSYKDGYEVEKELLWEIPMPDLKTSDGCNQYLTYDPEAKTYFATRQNGRLKQTFNAKDLASVPTQYRHYAELCNFKKIKEVTK